MALSRRELLQGGAVGAAGLVIGSAVGFGIGDNGGGESDGLLSIAGDARKIAEDRGFTPDDVSHALKSFVPPGKMDEFYIFASGGHSGQIIVVGVPSMRILKVIAVFTPEPWQGYGFGSDAGDLVLEAGTDRDGNKEISESRGPLTWGDSHHPAFSETNGEYDGRWIYINDRANGRIAMVDLRDWKTKEIFDVPNLQTSHGGIFITPNSEYVHISTMTPTLIPGKSPKGALDDYENSFRGYSTFLALKDNGRFDLERSFQLELPPYTQDLADSGKLASDGWVFLNSYNTEMAAGGNLHDPLKSLETTASANEFDFLHCINWRKAEQVAAAGKTNEVNGMRVIPLDTVIEEGLLYLVPEPRSPHGVSVSPDGNYLTVAGKLDPHVSVFEWKRISAAIEAEDFEGHDSYGIPIVAFDTALAGQVWVGLGPLHTQYDADGYGYTSLFIDSAVAKWSLGEPYHSGDDAFKLVDTIDIHYNIGHVSTMEGDSVTPQGKWLIALNKWSIDRYPVVGTLKPQNFQLVDISGDKMDLVYDMPIGLGEPHYVQAIRADRIKAWEVYPPGTNAATMEPDPEAIAKGEERVEINDDTVEIWMSVQRSHFTPDTFEVKKGQTVKIHLTNVETTPDATHGFAIPRYNINISIDPGEVVNTEFVADAEGVFALYCTEFCSALHLEMQGWMTVSA